MESSRFIGRVGALAVALGIGTALTTGTGIAWADDSGSSTSSSSSDSSGSSGSSDNSGSSGESASESSVSAPTAKTSEADDTATTPSRKDPLSKLGERLRQRSEAGADRAETAAGRAQTRVERVQSRLEDRREKLQAKIGGALGDAGGAAAAGDTDSAAAAGDADSPGESLAPAAIETTEPTPGPLVNPRKRPGPNRATSATEAAPVPEAPAAPRGNTKDSDTAKISPAALGTVPRLTQPEPVKTLQFRNAGEADEAVPQRGLAAITDPGAALKATLARTLPSVPVTAFVEPAAAPANLIGELPESPELTATSLVSALLAGLPVAAGTGSGGGGPSAALWALAAWARRETDQALTPDGPALRSVTEAQSLAATDVEPLAAAAWQANPGLTPAPVISGSTLLRDLGFITGENTPTNHWYVGGTDLGIMWVGDYEGQTPVVYTLFGDTFDDQRMTTGWRNNVLLRSVTTNLRTGLTFRDALIHAGANATNPGVPTWYGTEGARAGAAQIIYDPGYTGWFSTTYTMIPTSAIAVRNQNGTYTQYATVMSVRSWDNPGSWTTNYSGIAVSNDGGKTWTVDPDTVRASGWLRANQPWIAGNQNFQQNALVRGPDDDPNSWTSAAMTERYIFVYGTPSGRAGSAYLARVPESQLTNLSAYQYWAGENADGTGNWVTGDPSSATSVIGGGNSNYLGVLPTDGFLGMINKSWAGFWNGIIVGGLPTGGNISEMSVQYNEYLGRYVVTYTDSGNNVVMRVSASPQGTWSDPHTLIANNFVNYTGMYAPMIHPLSGTEAAGSGNAQYLYYNVSFWNNYNVKFMESNLSNLTIT